MNVGEISYGDEGNGEWDSERGGGEGPQHTAEITFGCTVEREARSGRIGVPEVPSCQPIRRPATARVFFVRITAGASLVARRCSWLGTVTKMRLTLLPVK